MGIKSIKIKTNNPFKIYKKIKNFIPKNQINFIEIETYRYVEHCGPNNDDKLNYRPKKKKLNIGYRKILIKKFFQTNM